MRDTDKQTLIDLYEILIVKNQIFWIKSILAFKICKLISLEYFELPTRSVLVIVASAQFKILLSILVNFLL